MKNKKYVLTEEIVEIDGITLYRIKSNTNLPDVKIGDLGGFVESEHNLSVYDESWVYDNAKVYGNAQVYDNAKVCGNAQVSGEAQVCGEALVCNSADYIVFKNWWSSGRFFTWTKSNNMWEVGCFYGTGEELIKKAYQDSEISGREYERIVQYVNSILADEKK